MRFVFNANMYGLRMIGLIGKDGAWFFGFATGPEPPK